MNPDVRETFINRSRIIREIRNYLDDRRFIEVETPTLQTVVGGAGGTAVFNPSQRIGFGHAPADFTGIVFKTADCWRDLDRVYEIGRVSGTKESSVRHNPEFTLLELYQAYTV